MNNLQLSIGDQQYAIQSVSTFADLKKQILNIIKRSGKLKFNRVQLTYLDCDGDIVSINIENDFNAMKQLYSGSDEQILISVNEGEADEDSGISMSDLNYEVVQDASNTKSIGQISFNAPVSSIQSSKQNGSSGENESEDFYLQEKRSEPLDREKGKLFKQDIIDPKEQKVKKLEEKSYHNVISPQQISEMIKRNSDIHFTENKKLRLEDKIQLQEEQTQRDQVDLQTVEQMFDQYKHQFIKNLKNIQSASPTQISSRDKQNFDRSFNSIVCNMNTDMQNIKDDINEYFQSQNDLVKLQQKYSVVNKKFANLLDKGDFQTKTPLEDSL